MTQSHPISNQNEVKSVYLDELTWMDAEKVLKRVKVVLIALGARTKEHGPHLLLKNDYQMAEYLKEQVAKHVPVAILPTLQYGYYPAFVEYPGSVSLRAETFKKTIIDICRSMNGYGVQKFYVLNTGVSTLQPLEAAAEELRNEGIILHYFNILAIEAHLPPDLLTQEGGTHADEHETSMMLYIAPESVDMTKAVKDYDARPNRRGLTRDPEGTGHYSPTGIWGDPTLATREKGKLITELTIQEIVRQVNQLLELKIDP